MKKILLCIFLAISVIGHSQKRLILDETWYSPSGKNFKIITCNKQISDSLYTISMYCYRVSVLQRMDRHGQYWEYTFYFKQEYLNKVVELYKRLNH